MPHLWVRSESRANERRVGLTPDGLRELQAQGFRITVEESPHRILPIAAFAEAGADIISAHVEAGPHIHRTLQAIRGAGVKAGLALNPGTSTEAARPLLDDVDLICVMTVNPGFGGQKFIMSQIEKVRELRAMIGDRPIHIEIDGGVDPVTAPLVAAAGADVLVAGSAVLRGGSVSNSAPYGENIRAIREAAEAALR